MQIRPTQHLITTDIPSSFITETPTQLAQYEPETKLEYEPVHQPRRMCLLLDIPAESLTHVTSSLEPPALLALSSVNRTMHAHVKDDNTWYRAFVYQMLGVSPEHDLDPSKTLMLRRCETSWRREYLLRFTLQRRWGFSPNTSITHIPHHSPVKSIHLTPSGLLLASSLQYGVVSRSLPFTGKILRGYLDASGTGLGVGNPNAEFTPNVTTCAISSEGGTAKILWGLVNGDVRFLNAAKAGDTRASLQLSVPSNSEETHRGAVLDTVWDEGKTDRAASCAMDGSVKVWDTKAMSCLWTAHCEPGEWAYRVATNLAQGIVACATSTRHVLIWRDLDTGVAGSLHRIKPLTEYADRSISTIHVEPNGRGDTVLVAHEGDEVFYRVALRENQDPEVVQFGEKGAAAITAIRPVFARSSEESSFIITGDSLGYISIYPWSTPAALASASPSSSPSLPLTSVPALHAFEAFPASAITALTWTPTSLLAGSASGSVRVFSPLPPFVPLRSLAVLKDKWRAGGQARERSVGMILIRSTSNGGPGNENGNSNSNNGKVKEEPGKKTLRYDEEEIVVCAGDSVLAFRAGAVPLYGGRRGGVRGRNTSGTVPKKGKRKVDPRWLKNTELAHSITESRKILELEHKELQASFGRAREHRGALDALGLSEAEALEYTMMLSREEDERRATSAAMSAGDDDVFADNFDELSLSPASPSSRSSASSPNGWDALEDTQDMLNTPTVESSTNPISVPVPQGQLITDSEANFPSISPSVSSSSSLSKRHSGSAWTSGSWSARSPAIGIRMSIHSSSGSSSGGSSPPRRGVGTGAASRSQGGTAAGVVQEEEEMDDDLRFAIELSLAEARSLGPV